MPEEEEISDAELNELVTGALSETLHLLHARQEDGVACAILLLLTRVANTWRTVATLWKHLVSDCPETFMVDAGTLVRASFEAYLQAAYIAHDPDKRRQLARDYLDFEHIERYELVTRILQQGSYIAEQLRNSPRRPEGEKRARKQYDSVRQRYLTRKGDRLRDRWYSVDLGSVARTVGAESEYDLLVYAFHPYVHSSAYGVRLGPPVEPQHVVTLAAIIAARTAKVALAYLGTPLVEPRQTVLDALADGRIGDPPTKPTCDDGAAEPGD